MQNITTEYAADKAHCIQILESFIDEIYTASDIDKNEGLDIIHYRVLSKLRDDLKFHIEYPYVDKVYRNTYYHYYSSKNDAYDRNSIRVSVFLADFFEDGLFSSKSIEQNYLGFFTIRPTFPNILGRNLLNPLAFAGKDRIEICTTTYLNTFNSLKVSVEAFPHASQDSEAMTCAETTLWSIVEYFSNKYNEYTPLLPNQIHDILKELTVERQVPSQGLSADQISYSLKKCGFGVKVYSKGVYGEEFNPILKTYIDSGIPFVAIVSNGREICHAFNIIGKGIPSEDDIRAIESIDLRMDGSLIVRDLNCADSEVVIIDDNCAPYRLADIDMPCKHYLAEEWQDCSIIDIIVPLHPKIYMDANQARKVSLNYIKLCNFAYYGRDMFARTFLCSSRSYKDYLFRLHDLVDVVKQILLSLSMPKFIWVTELYDNSEVLACLVEGLLILDATEPNKTKVIGAVFENKFVTTGLVDDEVIDLSTIGTSLKSFSGFTGNLKKF